MGIRILSVIVVACGVVGGWCRAGGAAAPGGKPNIVLFIGDDLTCSDIGPYGSPDVRTPHLAGLAKESLKFDAAFAASPTCTPARSAMYTGLYPMRNGAHANHALVNEGVETLPVYMGRLGYRVVIAGKTHIGPRKAFPFEYLANSNVMPAGRHEVLYTDLNTGAVDELLKTHDRGRPLCLIVAAHSSHVYWMENEGYDPAKVHLPGGFVDTPRTREVRCQYYTDVTHLDQQVGDVLASLEKYGYAGNTMFVFTADQGAQWPFGKWSLYDAGMRVPLMVRWPGHVKGGETSEAMVSAVDFLPTFMEAGGGTAPEAMDGKSFLGVLAQPGKEFREEVYAAHTGDKEMNHAPMRCVRTRDFKYIVNLRPDIEYTTHISNGEARDGRDYFEEWEKRAETDPAARAVVDRYYHKVPEELYDLRKDPGELKNVAGDPAYAKVLTGLREKVRRWRVQQGEDLNKVPLPEDARMGQIKYAG